MAEAALAGMYRFGLGVPKDHGEAARWYRKFAERGDLGAAWEHSATLVDAHLWLGRVYRDGGGVPQDYEEARKWFLAAANRGNAEAQSELAALEFRLENHAEAIKWWREAAEQGHAAAESSIGLMYDLGKGVLQDYQEAATWYRKAAEKGEPAAQLNLGSMFVEGKGVPQDYVQAHMWFNLAAVAKDFPAVLLEDAAKRRNQVANLMSKEQIAKAQELARNWRPGQKGDRKGAARKTRR